MQKALIAAVLMAVCAAGCKKHVNNAKPIPIAIHEVVSCNAVQSVPVINQPTGLKLCVDRKAIITEKQILDAQVSHYSTHAPQILVYLDRDGGARMYEATERISARYGAIAILIDGNLYDTMAVREPIKDALTINGKFTELAAQNLADALTAGK
jgi:preprotein translocase subunit SecD